MILAVNSIRTAAQESLARGICGRRCGVISSEDTWPVHSGPPAGQDKHPDRRTSLSAVGSGQASNVGECREASRAHARVGILPQENPEVSDWETKWAVEHGVSFFVYCWYRASQGKPVEMRFGSAIHEALFKAKFTDKIKFTIMWENQSRGTSGVADEQDLLQNLLPFWIENYFRHPSYLKVDNKPVLFIYRPEFLIQDLGSVENVSKALDRMRGLPVGRFRRAVPAG